MNATQALNLKPREIVLWTGPAHYGLNREHIVEEVFDDGESGIAIKVVQYNNRICCVDYMAPEEIERTGKRMSWLKKKILELI